MSHFCIIGRWICAFWLLVGLLPLSFELIADDHRMPVAELQLGNAAYRIEIAATPAQRRQGLMHRQHLDRDNGMLLLYPGTGDHRVWMKNMRIPLQVYWIDESFTVIEMQRLEPCSSAPCPIYSARFPSRFVLELGEYDHPLKPGDRIPELGNLK